MVTSDNFKLRGYSVVTDSNEIWARGNVIKLTPKELEVLVLLYHNRGKTVSRSEILEEVWGDSLGNNSGLTQVVSKLRRVFKDDPKRPKLIKTIPKLGYQLIPDHNLRLESNSRAKNLFMRFLSGPGYSKFVILFLLILISILLFVYRIEIRIDQLPLEEISRHSK